MWSARHAVGAHRPELTIEAGPELLQAHTPTLTRTHPRARSAPRLGPCFPARAHRVDVVLQIAIALALIVSVVLLIRNYRSR